MALRVFWDRDGRLPWRGAGLRWAGSIVCRRVRLEGSLVAADGPTLFESGIMLGASETRKVDVSVVGKQPLKLVVTTGGDTNASDHADWAGARLVK